jgi:hypothetical protein
VFSAIWLPTRNGVRTPKGKGRQAITYTILTPNNNMNEQEQIQKLNSEISRLKDMLDKVIKVGNTMSIKTGVYPCAKYYQGELKDWADIVTKYNEEESK